MSSLEQFSYSVQSSTPAPVVSEVQLMATFKAIEEIPDSVLQAGDGSAQSWIKDRVGEFYSEPGTVTTFGVVGYVSAIGLALVTNLPVFKITKIRTALKAAGDATTFIKTSSVYTTRSESKSIL